METKLLLHSVNVSYFAKIPLTNVFFKKYGYRSSIFLLYFSESAVLIHILQPTERFAGLSLPA